MKVQLLIAMSDKDYVDHITRELAERWADIFELSICTSEETVQNITRTKRYDIALLDAALAQQASLSRIRMPMLLWDGMTVINDPFDGVNRIRKYQRISSIVSCVLEKYAEISDSRQFLDDAKAKTTVVWSPAGGCGKTTVALAYSAQQVSQGKKVLYLDLQPFSTADIYFTQAGKSISTVFGKLEGDLGMLVKSVRQEDHASGIYYFSPPENYDDVRILTSEDLELLLKGCMHGVDELIVDLGSTYDEKTLFLLEFADQVMVVVDSAAGCKAKWNQFCSQHNLFETIREKLMLVANRGAKFGNDLAARVVSLPVIKSENPVVVYKTLSAKYFM